MATFCRNHTVLYLGLFLSFVAWKKLTLCCPSCPATRYSPSPLLHFFITMAQIWKQHTFTQKANAVAKVQAFLAHQGAECTVHEACKKCGVSCIIYIKWSKSIVTIKSNHWSWIEKKILSSWISISPSWSNHQWPLTILFSYHDHNFMLIKHHSFSIT